MDTGERGTQGAIKPANSRLTDSTIVSIEVLSLPPEKSNRLSVPGEEDGPTKESKRRFSLFKRKASTSKSKEVASAHIVKEMTYAEYLKHYALDDYGRYIGTEDPAPDCILRDASDVARYKMPAEYRDLLGDTKGIGQSPLNLAAGVGAGVAMIGSTGGF